MSAFLDALYYRHTSLRTKVGWVGRFFRQKGRPIFRVDPLTFEIGHKGSGVLWKTQMMDSDFNSIPWWADDGLGFDPMSHFKKPSVLHDDGYKRHIHACSLMIHVMRDQKVELRIFGIHVNKRHDTISVRKFCDLIYLHAMQVVIEHDMPEIGFFRRLWFRLCRTHLYVRALILFAAVRLFGRRAYFKNNNPIGDLT